MDTLDEMILILHGKRLIEWNNLRENAGCKVRKLYVVNTTISPSFLDQLPIQDRSAEHHGFVDRIKRFYPEFDIPYLALFSASHLMSRGLVIPDNFRERSTRARVIQSEVPFRNGEMVALDDVIDAAVRGVSVHGEKLPKITAVVEFSNTELYRNVMGRLGQKYDLEKIRVK